MGAVPVLPLSDVVDVVIQVSPQLPATPTFNQGLYVSTDTAIPSVGGTNPRLRPYTSSAAMLADGFTSESDAYLASLVYFGQEEPAQIFNVGRQDLTAIAAVSVAAGGTGYAVGDIVTVTESSASLGMLKVATVAGGVVTGLSIMQGKQGTGYSVSTALATTGGTGTGLTINITAIGETPLQAVQACRLVSASWYMVVLETATDDEDILAIAAWAEANLPQLAFAFTTSDAAVLNGTANNIFAQLQTLDYSRTFGIYSTTQSDLSPNNAYAAVAVMGVAMGLNTGLANSAFSLKFKALAGITPEPLEDAQRLSIESFNGNVYVMFGGIPQFTWLEQGVMADGQFFDEVLNFDMLASDYQFSILDVFISNPKVPQTDPGQTQLLNAVDGANSRAANRGFIAGGTWEGQTILNLTAGMALPLGYLSQSPAFATQAPSDRSLRKSMPIYVAIIEAGAIHSVLIGVYVQR